MNLARSDFVPFTLLLMVSSIKFLAMALINKLAEIATQAGKIILEYYNKDYSTQVKDDNSPVTEADIAANDYIMECLTAEFPDIPIISEEGEHIPQGAGKFFLVDPLDGTKSFIKKSGQFTVNIGLIENQMPTAGVIYVPTDDNLYFTDGKKAKKNGKKIECREIPKQKVVVVASKTHRTSETDEFIEGLNIDKLVSASSSLKFCMVAEGIADIYPRFGRTMEWDTAAGQAILQAAGGEVIHPDGRAFNYAKNDIFENGWFIAYGKR